MSVLVGAPTNRTPTAAVDAHRTPDVARTPQRGGDRVITLRAVLQGLAVLALCLGLLG